MQEIYTVFCAPGSSICIGGLKFLCAPGSSICIGGLKFLCAPIPFGSTALANRHVVREEGSGGSEGKLWNGAKANRCWLAWWVTQNYHRGQSQSRLEFDKPFISEGINDWHENPWAKHQVNILSFTFDWVNYFNNNEDLWPTSHRRKSQYTWRKYDYDIKQKSNLFILDLIYRKIPKKSFAKGRKQEFEILISRILSLEEALKGFVFGLKGEGAKVILKP
ncbi:MAG: hypothetical protein ACYCVD_17300 [Desulfitobacteriaceae bacterium]